MAYQIYYSPENNNKYPVKQGSIKVKWSRITICVILLIVAVLYVQNRHTIRQWLLPGDPVQTEAALTNFVDSVRIGEPFKEAVTAFCLEILENAKPES